VALALCGCTAPSVEMPVFTATGAGRIVVPVTGALSLTATLRAWGHAALVLDSFHARGVRSVCKTGAVTSEARVDDASAALRTMAAHPGWRSSG